ncbi:MAG: phospholipid carrier-dependent glycosyltransferase [Alphaproteobacteria bacterium]|nr:phospholipid carrier-dependent glycosyltransferase [Alphaproteobacteria bacterium]
MYDPLITLAALAHALLLAGAVVWACRRWAVPRRDWPFAVYIVFWADLVLAGHFASLVKALDQPGIYAAMTFAAMALLLALFRYVDRARPSPPLLAMPPLAFATVEDPQARRFLTVFLIATLAFVALASIVIGFSVYPDNADSMIYRLPRAFWYVSNGSFLHPFDSIDKRITFYPLDGVALYVPLVLYNLPGTLHALPSLVTWMMLAYTAYRFARELGAERFVALFAAWLVVVTPSILAQATSTNDEILCAVALLTGLYMGWRWLVTGRHGYFLLAAIAVGLSVGTKLHIVFLAPVILAAMGIALWHIRRKPSRFKEWLGAVGWRTGLVSLLMAAVMIMPFLLYNYISSGRFYFVSEFANDVFNLKASLRGSLQNLLIYASQMVLSPIADLNSWPVANDRQHFNNILNAVFYPLIKPFISDDPSFYHMGYRFVGITIPVSVRFVEFSLWSAFVWLLWPWQAWLTLRQKFPLRSLFFLLAMTPPVWLLLWSFSTLYMEGTATYFTFYLICAAPAAVFVFTPIQKPFWSELRWVVVLVVTLTNLIISVNMLMFSGFRALPDLYYARTWPYDWDLAEPGIIEEIRLADRMRIPMLHEKTPYFAYMHWHPNARFYSPYPVKDLLEPEKILQVLTISGLDRYGFMPLKIPGKATPGLTYIGAVRAIGREAIFATGNGVEQRHPEHSGYIIPQVSTTPIDEGALVSLGNDVAGLSPDDNLEFSYEITNKGHTLFQSGWKREPGFKVKIMAYNPMVETILLTIVVRSAWSHKELTRATYRINGPGAWLPEGGEY